MQSDPVAEALFSKCSPEPNSGCWLWLGTVTGRGYGRVTLSRKTLAAHRASYAAHCGPIPRGMFVCHRCDVPACINPNHLFVGTNADNVRDMVAKGRHAHAERHGSSKLTAKQRQEIRASRKPTDLIAAEYGVSRSRVQRIRKGFVAPPERRRLLGLDHPLAKLSPEQRAEIQALQGQMSQRKLAARYGVALATIFRTLRGEHA